MELGSADRQYSILGKCIRTPQYHLKIKSPYHICKTN